MTTIKQYKESVTLLLGFFNKLTINYQGIIIFMERMITPSHTTMDCHIFLHRGPDASICYIEQYIVDGYEKCNR